MQLTNQMLIIWCFFFVFQPFPKQQILDSSKLKEFADDNFKFDKNGIKISKPVKNAVGKGEIALPTVFSKDLYSRQVKTGACEKRRKC